MLNVIKRDGSNQAFNYDKLHRRIVRQTYGLDARFIDTTYVAGQVRRGLFNEVSTYLIDELTAETCASMIYNHHDYSQLAARIAITKLHKYTDESFYDVIKKLHLAGLISEHHFNIVQNHRLKLDATLIHNRDFLLYNYIGYKTLEKSYLLKIDGKTVERPQHMLMRVAVAIHENDISSVALTYNHMSRGYFTHASPTLFNACGIYQQLSSCFLLSPNNQQEIENMMKQCSIISNHSGGIGINIHCLKHEKNNLINTMKKYNNVSLTSNQGGDKRPGAFAVYLEPWHADIFDFLELKRNIGDENRARDLFYGLWIPDLFMRRVEENDIWSLMCPSISYGLSDVWGNDFDKLYIRYEKEGRYVTRVPARDLWLRIIRSQVETGTPYMLYKDQCNRKSNHQHLGTIKSSNLCTEIIEYSDSSETAVCNLASIALNKFVIDGSFDFLLLRKIIKIITINLNRIIDVNFYPTEETKLSNLKHRPIGIGVQGLADTFHLLRYPFESKEAKLLNIKIFETIYYSALETSCDLARENGPYESYKGSFVSKGILQHDMWNVKPCFELWNWDYLREKIKCYGIKNSLLVAPMPTASTAQIMGNNESIEPYTSNIYNRRVLSGEFIITNKHLINDLVNLGLWDKKMKNDIIAEFGSVQNIDRMPNNLKKLYKTVWEIPQKTIIDMAVDRAPFIDQSQSLNIHISVPSTEKITLIHFYGWKKGLKTGMYYLRTRPAANPQQITVDKEKENCISCTS